jgi:hypothetical protein
MTSGRSKRFRGVRHLQLSSQCTQVRERRSVSLWAPPRDNTSDVDLFGIIGNERAYGEERRAPMAIRAPDQMRVGHRLTQGFQNLLHRLVVCLLPEEAILVRVFVLAIGCYTVRKRTCRWLPRVNAHFGMARNAIGMTASRCARRMLL